MMKWILPVLLLSASTAQAQNCTSNVDAAGNVCTAFTLGSVFGNTLPVLTQDGTAVAPNAGYV